MVEKVNEIKSNLLQCPLENNNELFFSLMDYLNNLFMSKDPTDILRFYDYFENNDQLIKWMKEKPKGNYRIVEFNKDENDIIVVIPTMDINGKFAKNCREDIFKGLHIIYVESGVGNYYFNYAHNCNTGIKRAMEYNPKWIILSNDDMYKIDDINILINELYKLDPLKIDSVFITPTIYHSYDYFFGIPRFTRNWQRYIFKHTSWKYIKNVYKKFNIKYQPIWLKNKYLEHFFYKKIQHLILFGSFGIFSYNFINKLDKKLFDETFINGVEDVDASIKINLFYKYVFIDFKIGDFIGASLSYFDSKNRFYLPLRSLRSLVNLAYFNNLLKSYVSLYNF